ncbi:pyrroline-5-carboxylate reductase [Paenibacillus sp.]|jgi:pyrroline-5-carboxylate reductase|uniref:pyrroline-5-carboxylate reductase n=1 Tax=Paenibacillus sp. TaxID=58172 RepID=UPI002824BF87|nr:pyrroline-5-carboxylate reductase [Paenibacillus sp.]MDR0270665.1 pyrroline-5-carboxylate reductase [Paenibacillus sp.]
MSQQQAMITEAITFYGAGAMAEAIVKGLISKSVVQPGDITMLNRSNSRRLEELQRLYGVKISNDADVQPDILQNSPVIVLAMKPKDAAEALRNLGPLLSDETLIVSVIAGLTIRTIQDLLGRKQPIARTMPNTSSSIGLGATGIAYSKEMSDRQRQIVMTLFGAVGTVTNVEEEKLEILTGISGSGPAYIYYMMEAMMAAGIRSGLSPQQCRELTVQTVLGAARMVQLTGEEPSALRAKVTSPNGSTQAAIETLDKGDFFETVIAAVARCAERSKEMGAALKEGIY